MCYSAVENLERGYMTTTTLPALSTENGLAKYIDEIKKFPILSEHEEKTLADDWIYNGNIEAAQKLVSSHLRLVVKIAMQFRGYGLPLLDMISEGNIGLMTAVKKFDPKLGHRLATYAMWWIKAQIQDYILKSCSMIKIGTSATQKKLFFNLKKIRNKITQENNGVIPYNEHELIAGELGVDARDVKEMSDKFESFGASLNSSSYGDDDSGEILDTIVEPSENQEVVLLEADDYNRKSEKLKYAFEHLNDREKYIIQVRRLSEKAEKLEDIGEKFGISSERVRQIENAAMKKLTKYANE